MARRSRSSDYDRPPTVRDLADAFGFGWVFDLGKAVLCLALLAGGVWLRYHGDNHCFPAGRTLAGAADCTKPIVGSAMDRA